jgi:surface protein
MFCNCEKFNSDLSKWDVSSGVKFNCMFSDCKEFNSDLSKWDVHNGEKFDKMFYGCASFNVDLSGWNVSNAKSWVMFCDKSLLEKYPERIPVRFRKEYL